MNVSDDLIEIDAFCAIVGVFPVKETERGRGGIKYVRMHKRMIIAVLVRVTLECGLLFASSFTTGQSQRGRRGSLANDYVQYVPRGG